MKIARRQGGGVMGFDLVEKFRRRHPLGLIQKTGDDYGWFEIPSPVDMETLYVMVAPSDAEWQHVSVSARECDPCWLEMCFIKDLLFAAEDVVVQFHPKKSDYINMAEHCLHLWRWNGGGFPCPPSYLVGFKIKGDKAGE